MPRVWDALACSRMLSSWCLWQLSWAKSLWVRWHFPRSSLVDSGYETTKLRPPPQLLSTIYTTFNHPLYYAQYNCPFFPCTIQARITFFIFVLGPYEALQSPPRDVRQPLSWPPFQETSTSAVFTQGTQEAMGLVFPSRLLKGWLHVTHFNLSMLRIVRAPAPFDEVRRLQWRGDVGPEVI